MSAARLPPPADPDTLYVMDLSGYVFRAYHAVPPLSNSKGEPTNAVHGVTAMMNKLVAQRRPAYFAVAVDSPGTFRKALFAEYKATRKERPADLLPQALRVQQVAAAYNIPCLSAPGMEADDVIATVVKKARADGLKVVIASADKDLLQLVGDGVVMFDSMRERVFGPDETVEKLGVQPAQVRDLLALTGDTSDNVPGVPSVGPKTAVALLTQFPSLEALYANLEQVEKKSLREKLAAHRDLAMLSQQLVTLREDVDIPWDLEALRYGGADLEALRALLTELELSRALDELERTFGAGASTVGQASVAVGASTVPGRSAPPTDAGGLAPAEAAPRAADPSRARPVRAPHRGRIETDAALLPALFERSRASGELVVLTLLEGEDPLVSPLVGLAFAWWEDEAIEAVYVPIGHVYLGRPVQPSADAVAEALRGLVAQPSPARVGHDLKREALVWRRRGVPFPVGQADFDTMLASYLLDAERHAHDLEACARFDLGEELASFTSMLPKGPRGTKARVSELDVERAGLLACARAACVLELRRWQRGRLEREGLTALMQTLEMPLEGVLATMESLGVLVDVACLARLGVETEARARALEQRCHELAGHAFNVASPRALETVLFDELGLPAGKKTKTGRSTDHEVLEELSDAHPLPDVILELRKLQKLRGTYIEALPRQIDPFDGRVHTRFNQAVAATGRLSSSEPNLQNIPIRTEDGRAIREAFVPAPGWSMLSADYSQIELRVLAHVSSDPELVAAFTTDTDVHSRTAMALFDVPLEGVTREMRGRAKTVNFAVLYGQTEFALARGLSIDRKEARGYIEAFFKRYAGVTRYLDELVVEARETGVVRTLLGRRRAIPDLRSPNRTLRMAAERVAKNTPIQGSAADILKLAMVSIQRQLEASSLQSRMILTVHDELVFEVAPGEAAMLEPLVKRTMESAHPLAVPLVVEVGIGPTWGQAH